MKNRKNALFACMAALGLSLSSIASAENARVWLHFTPNAGNQVQQAIGNAGGQIHHRFDDLNAMAASIPGSALSGLSNNPNVTLIEEDPKRYPYAQNVPYGIDAVQARDIWDADRDGNVDTGAPTGAGRLVCVIDSGMYTAHEDLASVNVVGGYPAGWNNDTCGHGSHVAGTIAAANNNTGVVGVSPGAVSMYIVKVFDGASCGWSYSSDLVDAAQRCQTAGANVISMSLGGSTQSNAEKNAFAALDAAGILSIAAAGNDGNTRKSYPASYDAVMSVAAVDSNNLIADFSQQNAAVEIAAPGVAVMSTLPWKATNTLTVGASTYDGGHIEFAALGSATGALVDGGLCDSTGAWSGQVVLCERGTVAFYDKVLNVQNSGGAATVIYNNVPGGFAGTLGAGNSSTIPAISLSQEDGQALVAASLGASGTVTSTLEQPASGYEAWNGTSMATPHVSGVAALVWSSDTSKTNAEIRAALTGTALDLGDPGRDVAYGYGLVQAHAAWQALGGGGGSANQAPVASFSFSCTDLSCNFDASASSDSDGGIVSYSWDFGDGGTASGAAASHSYASAGDYTVILTVTDDGGATDTDTQTVSVSSGGGGGGDTNAPVISNVTSVDGGGPAFNINWSTDEASDSTVTFTCCGVFNDTALVTSHSMGFRGSNGALYEYWVSSTDAAGNTATAGPFYHQN